MAGHSKWANIKHKKGRADAKRGKEFSRITKEIITAVKLGGPDPKSNAKLSFTCHELSISWKKGNKRFRSDSGSNFFISEGKLMFLRYL